MTLALIKTFRLIFFFMILRFNSVTVTRDVDVLDRNYSSHDSAVFFVNRLVESPLLFLLVWLLITSLVLRSKGRYATSNP